MMDHDLNAMAHTARVMLALSTPHQVLQSGEFISVPHEALKQGLRKLGYLESPKNKDVKKYNEDVKKYVERFGNDLNSYVATNPTSPLHRERSNPPYDGSDIDLHESDESSTKRHSGVSYVFLKAPLVKLAAMDIEQAKKWYARKTEGYTAAEAAVQYNGNGHNGVIGK